MTTATRTKEQTNALTRDQVIELIAKGEYNLVDRLKEMDKAEAQAKAEREADLIDIFNGIAETKLTLSELFSYRNKEGQTLFSVEQLKDYCQFINLIPKKGKGSKKATGTTKTPSTELVLFTITTPKELKLKGPTTTIYKGKAFPIIKDGLPAKFFWLYNQTGNLEDNLKKFAEKTPEAIAYLETAEGKAEVTKWVDWIKKEGKATADKAKAPAPATDTAKTKAPAKA